jgi:uncharacterized membrane protein YphA (DoxX/SURF4 family)
MALTPTSMRDSYCSVKTSLVLNLHTKEASHPKVLANAPQSQVRPSWPKDALRITFGAIWLVDAILKWLPGFRRDYMGTIMGQAQGQPAWLKTWFDFWINLQHPRTVLFADVVALIETIIAVALIIGFARKINYIAATVFSLLIWMTAEGFGGPCTTGAADVGTALIYALVFISLMALSYYSGVARFSVDYYLEHRITWWWRVAEMRRPMEEVIPAPVEGPIEKQTSLVR